MGFTDANPSLKSLIQGIYFGLYNGLLVLGNIYQGESQQADGDKKGKEKKPPDFSPFH